MRAEPVLPPALTPDTHYLQHHTCSAHVSFEQQLHPGLKPRQLGSNGPLST